jgi:hypothetical protein
MGEKRARYYFLIFLTAASVLAAFFAYLGTQRAGPGVSGDGIQYLSTADSLLHGHGLTTSRGVPLTQFPPVYSILLAGLSRLSGQDIFIVGWWLNIAVCFGIIFSAGLLFYRVLQGRPVLAYAATLVIASSVAVVDMCASITSDPIMLLFVIWFLLLAAEFADTRRTSTLIWMAFLACVASMERYSAFALTLTGSAQLLWLYRDQLRAGIFRATVFGLSGIPMVLWGVFHNYPATGWLFGVRPPPLWKYNLYLTAEKISNWFVPYSIIRLLTPAGIFAVGVVLLILLNRWVNWRAWAAKLIEPRQLASTIFLSLYLLLMVFYTTTYDINPLDFQRFHVIVLPSVLLVLGATYQELLPPRAGDNFFRYKDWAFVLLLVVWLAYPTAKILDYVHSTSVRGEVTYNGYNWSEINDSAFLKAAQALPTDQTLYANYVNAGWFYLRRGIVSLPSLQTKGGQVGPRSAATFTATLAPGGGGYILWFKTVNTRDDIPTLDQLRQYVQFQPVFTSEVGDIYQIVPSGP